MKKLIYLPLFLCVTIGLAQAGDITLDKILQTNYKSLGGLEKLRAVDTIHVKGKVVISMQNLELPMEMWYKKPNQIRMESEFQGMKILQVYDGKKAWGLLPFAGKGPQELPADQAEDIIEQAEGLFPLIDYKEKGHKLEYVGKEEMQGTEVYKLKLTRKNGRITFFFLDTESCVELKTLTYIKKQDKEIKAESYLGDYKEFNGLMMPTSIESRMNDQVGATIQFEMVEINVKVDDSIFILPKKEQ